MGTLGCQQEQLKVSEVKISQKQLEEIFIAHEQGGSAWKEIYQKYELNNKENMQDYIDGLNNLKLDQDAYHQFLHSIYIKHIRHSKPQTLVEGEKNESLTESEKTP